MEIFLKAGLNKQQCFLVMRQSKAFSRRAAVRLPGGQRRYDCIHASEKSLMSSVRCWRIFSRSRASSWRTRSPGNVIPFAYLAQGDGLVGEQAILQDVYFLFVELGHDGFRRSAPGPRFRPRPECPQCRGPGREEKSMRLAPPGIFAHLDVEREVRGGQPLVHLIDLVLGHARRSDSMAASGS